MILRHLQRHLEPFLGTCDLIVAAASARTRPLPPVAGGTIEGKMDGVKERTHALANRKRSARERRDARDYSRISLRSCGLQTARRADQPC